MWRSCLFCGVKVGSQYVHWIQVWPSYQVWCEFTQNLRGKVCILVNHTLNASRQLTLIICKQHFPFLCYNQTKFMYGCMTESCISKLFYMIWSHSIYATPHGMTYKGSEITRIAITRAMVTIARCDWLQVCFAPFYLQCMFVFSSLILMYTFFYITMNL